MTNWCHNPAIVVQDNGDGTSTWALFHIGAGTGGSTKNCSGSASSFDAAEQASLPASSASGSTLHTAPGPDGPWTPAPQLPSCNNPAPFLAKNGTWLLVCNGFTLYSAPNLNGTWTQVTQIKSTKGSPLPGNYEVSVLFCSRRFVPTERLFRPLRPPPPFCFARASLCVPLEA